MSIPEGFYKFTTIVLLVLIAAAALSYKSYQMGADKVPHQVERTNTPSTPPAPVAVLPPSEPVTKPKIKIKKVAAINAGEISYLKKNITQTPVPVPVPTLALYKMNGNSIFQPVPFPYLAPLHQSMDHISNGGNGRDFVVVDTYQLTAVGSNFTVSNLSASDETGRVTPYFLGISDGQVIASGKSIQFKLICPDTQSNWVNLKYNFKIAETGDTFTYLVKALNN